MADKGPDKAARDRLQAVLAAYGADPARWPERDRELASLLTSADPDLTVPLEDARAVDRALARASHPVVPAGSAERLIARVDDGPDNVVSFVRHGQARPPSRQAALPGRLAVLTTLAASLALGLYLGATGQTDWLTPPLLAEESPEYLSAELDVLDRTLQLLEDHMEP
jgi:hypothetical protein